MNFDSILDLLFYSIVLFFLVIACISCISLFQDLRQDLEIEHCIDCLLEILDKLDIENTKLRVQCYCSEVMVEVYREMFNNLFKKEISYGKQ